MKRVGIGREKPQRGSRLPDLSYVSVDGEKRRLSDWRGRYNLVLIVARNIEDPLLNAIARNYAEFPARDARVLAILQCDPTDVAQARDSRRWLFDVAADACGLLSRELAGQSEAEEAGTAVFITDRWSEVFFASRSVDGDAAPDVRELLGWLTFVEHQCPECFPSEWSI
jgi:peroxiredoxin